MSAGTRRNGSSKFGPFTRTAAPGHPGSSGHQHGSLPVGHGHDAYLRYDQTAAWDADDRNGAADPAHDLDTANDAPERERPAFGSGPGARRAGQPGRRAGQPARYAGRHATARRKTARIRARQAVPATVVAAAVVAGAAAYTLAGSSQPQAAQLNDAMSAPLILSAAAPAGRADTAASAMIQATKTPGTARPSATASAKPPASRTRAAAKSAASPTTTASATTSATPAASASSSPTASTLSCNLSYGLLPDNVTAIVSFLLANGYTDNAAAGIAGNIYQESKGDPESIGMGGGGLIGWTPLPSGFVTGDPEADLQTQLAAILTYNQQWSSYLPALNSAASPADAAYIYVTDFERAGIPAASTREAAAEDVASACGI